MKINLKNKISKIKKKKKLVISLTAFALAAAVTGTLVFRNIGPQNAIASEAVTMNASVQKGDLSTTIEATGTLENSDTELIQIPDNIKIDTVKVSAGDEVKKNDILAVVDEVSLKAELYLTKEQLEDLEDDIGDTDSTTAEYYGLLSQKADLEEKYKVLKKIAKKNTITAAADGVITTVYISDGTTGTTANIDSTGTSSGAEQMNVSSLKSTADVIALSTVQTAAAENAEDSPSSQDSPAQIISINKIVSLGITKPVTGQKPDDTIQETDFYTGEIKWESAPSIFKADEAYTAFVTLTAKDGYRFSEDISVGTDSAKINSRKINSEEEKNTLTLELTYEKTEKNTDEKQPDTTGQNDDYINSAVPDSQSDKVQYSGNAGSSASSGINTGTNAGSSASDTSSSDSAGTNSSELTTAFEIASGSSMTLYVNVDELDVLSISKGQKAVLTLDAIEEEEFEGEITNLNLNGISNNGTTKYEVEIQVNKSSSMMSGMNASASIVTEEKKDVLILPSAAISEQGNTCFVYTNKDGNTGELSGKTEIETGSSDGINVEITNGLAEGDTVYYEIADTAGSDSETPFKDFGDAGADFGMPGEMGEMPSGMPDNGFGSKGGPGQ